jgi:molybdopterin-guanine dinucleotide biosynthesis protein A
MDKGLIPYKHLPMVQHVINRLEPQVNSLVISANRNLDQYRMMAKAVVTDCLEEHGGPLIGLFSAMCFLRNHAVNNNVANPVGNETQTSSDDWIVISPCDAPLLPTNLVEQLAFSLASAKQPVQCLMPHDGIRNQPLFSMLTLSTLPMLKNAIDAGERKAERWLLSLNPTIVDCTSNAEGFSNINTMDDLQGRQE